MAPAPAPARWQPNCVRAAQTSGWRTPPKARTSPCRWRRTGPVRPCCRCRPSTAWPMRCRWRGASIRTCRHTSTRLPRRSSARAARKCRPGWLLRRRSARLAGARACLRPCRAAAACMQASVSRESIPGSCSMQMRALVNGRVLLEDGFHGGLAVLHQDGRVVAVVDADDRRVQDADCIDLQGGTLVPGFIDAQVNGGGGVLFNNTPSVERIRAIARAHRRFGTTGLLPTLISDRVEVMREAVDAVHDAIAQRVPGVLGIHLEGPYLAPARKGTHDAGMFRAPDADEIALATSLDNGVTLLTLAPEQVPPQTL